MVKTTIHLDMPGKSWAKWLVRWCNPIDDRSLQALGVIGSCTGHASLDLWVGQVNTTLTSHRKDGVYTKSDILPSSPSSESLFMILSWSPGIIFRRVLNTWNSLRCLWSLIVLKMAQLGEFKTDSILKDSSGSSARSPLRRRPFKIIDWILHKAWAVLPKCRPWWTNGSERHLFCVST